MLRLFINSMQSYIIFILLLSITLIGCNSIERRQQLPLKRELVAIKNKATFKIFTDKKIATIDSSKLQDNAIILASDHKYLFTIDFPNTIIATDLEGKIIWKKTVTLADRVVTSGPVNYQDKLMVITSDPKLLCLSALDGKILWETELSSNSLALPAVTAKEVFVHTIDGGLTALKLSDGNQIWRVSTALPEITLLKGSQPSVLNNYVVTGFAGGKLSAIDKLSGEILWSLDLADPQGKLDVDRIADISAAPIILADKVYAISSQGLLVSVNLSSGDIIWKKQLSSYHDMVIAKGAVYVLGTDGKLFSIEQSTGKTIWVQDQFEGRDLTKPILFKNYIVLGDDEGHLHFIDKLHGTIENRISLGRGGITIAPIVTDFGKLQILTNKGHLINLSIFE